VPGFVVAQLAGALIAALLSRALFPTVEPESIVARPDHS
jgi:hypothetical protein